MDDQLLEKLRTEGDQPDPLFPAGKVCELDECRTPLVQRDGEKTAQFRSRRFCNGTCSSRHHGKARKLAPESKVCADDGCDNVFVRDTKRESRQRWALHRYCSVACSSRNTKRVNVGRKAAVVVEPVRRRPGPGERVDVFGEVVPEGYVWRPAAWRERRAS